MADGFSFLLEDKNYRPVILNKFTKETSITKKSITDFCEDWLMRHTLIESFVGELTIITDSLTSSLVPKDLFSENDAPVYLNNSAQIQHGYSIETNSVKNRQFVIIHAVSDIIKTLAAKFKGEIRILPSSEVLISMSDQINASDHQRGFALIEAQPGSLNILMIKNDQVDISNQLKLKNTEDLCYHTLNTLQHLNFDREKSPLFYSGVILKNQLEIFGKYIRNVKPLSYHIQNIDKASISEHIVLAEATRCG
jgi:hypothetical protein